MSRVKELVEAGPLRGRLRALAESPAVPWLVLFAALAFAYADLFGFDPYRPQPGDLPGLEGTLFVPRAVSWWFVVTAFVWRLVEDNGRIRAALEDPGRPALSFAFFVPCLALFLWAHLTDSPALLIPSLSLFLVGGGLAAGGARAARALGPPAVILLFAIPPPPALLNEFVFALQLWTARVASFLASLYTPTVRSEDLIFAHGHIFQVIESCSGLAIIGTLTVTSFILPTRIQRSRLHAVLLFLAAPVVGAVANMVRVLTIMANPLSGINAVHTAQGIVMLVAGVLALAGIDQLLGRWLPRGPKPKRARNGAPSVRVPLLALAVGALALGLLPWLLPTFDVETLRHQPFRELRAIEGLTGKALGVDDEYLGSVHFTQATNTRYVIDEMPVDLFVGVNNRDLRHTSAQSPKTLRPGAGYTVLDRRPATLTPGRRVEVLELAGPSDGVGRPRHYLAHHFTLGIRSIPEEALRQMLGLERSPFQRRDREVVVRLTTPLDPWAPRQAAIREAEQRLEAVRARLEPNLANEGPQAG